VTQKDISVPLSALFSHNTKQIDDDAPRLAFIRSPIEIQLAGEHPSQIEVDVHPNHAAMGQRSFTFEPATLWLEEEDMAKGNLRLKGFADLEITGQSATVASIERSDQRPIVHWLSETESCEATLIVAKDGEIIEHKGRMERHGYPAGTMVQLERIGYGRVLDATTLLFSHS
jgi:glutamyl-tRNA synthetase